MQRVIERILNLLAFLLTERRPVAADEIRFNVLGYEDKTDEAFKRIFERDKDVLRSLGVPLRLDYTDAWEVDRGYVLSPEQYALADPGLDDDERAALALAARMARLGGEEVPTAALRKLGGMSGDDGPSVFAADLGAMQAELGAVFLAVTEHRLLTFDYRGSTRKVRPLSLLHRRGHWYVEADTVEGERRVYRVDRMEGTVAGEKPGAFERPRGFRPGQSLPDAPWEAGTDEHRAEIRFDAEIAWWARRQLPADAEVREEADGSIVVTLTVAAPQALFGWLIGFDDAAEILGPDDLVAAFVDHVRGAA